MTAPRIPRAPEGAASRWYARPRVVLPLIASILIISALLAPEVATGRSGDPRLTTHSTRPQGARLFYDLARKVGYRVSRREVPEIGTDERSVQAILSTPIPLRAREVHEVLEHVRAGGGLFLVLGLQNDALGDSIGVVSVSPGAIPAVTPEDTAGCGTRPTPNFPQLWPSKQAFLTTLQWRRRKPDDIASFLRVAAGARGAQRLESMIGFEYGKGRVVVGSDPDILRNDALRVCHFGLDVPVVRALEYLRDGGDRSATRDRMVFDEFHQGYGSQPGAMRAIGEYLISAPSGRAFTQVVVAGLILLAVFAPRVVTPRDNERIERRSPLEHVDALARAYERVGASKTIVARLVRGMRRRLHATARPGARAESDAEFLARAARQKPSVSTDVERINHALRTRVTPRELEEVGESLQRLESSLTRM